MKLKNQRTITIDEIIETLDSLGLEDARTALYQTKGAAISITGKVEKLIKRHGGVRLFVAPHQESELDARRMMIFAEFDDEAEQARVIEAKIRKGSSVCFTGKFQTFGETGVNVIDCRLEQVDIQRGQSESI